jgi:hypothetical protein
MFPGNLKEYPLMLCMRGNMGEVSCNIIDGNPKKKWTEHKICVASAQKLKIKVLTKNKSKEIKISKVHYAKTVYREKSYWLKVVEE